LEHASPTATTRWRYHQLVIVINITVKKVKLSHYMPWRHMEGEEV
jgi:hypothetical protein